MFMLAMYRQFLANLVHRNLERQYGDRSYGNALRDIQGDPFDE